MIGPLNILPVRIGNGIEPGRPHEHFFGGSEQVAPPERNPVFGRDADLVAWNILELNARIADIAVIEFLVPAARDRTAEVDVEITVDAPGALQFPAVNIRPAGVDDGTADTGRIRYQRLLVLKLFIKHIGGEAQVIVQHRRLHTALVAIDELRIHRDELAAGTLESGIKGA